MSKQTKAAIANAQRVANNRSSRFARFRKAKAKSDLAWKALVVVAVLLLCWLCSGYFRASAYGQTLQRMGILSDDEEPFPGFNMANIRKFTTDILTFGPRVGGNLSPGSARTLQYMSSHLRGTGWNISLDTFKQNTIVGPATFTNIVASKVIGSAPGVLVLAAHWDSKQFADFEFVGAIDSAVSCAILLELARHYPKDTHFLPSSVGRIDLVFFDGEEAYKDWTDTDSLYGATHLAQQWEALGKLNDIVLFVLLDLVGWEGQIFSNLHRLSTPHFERLEAMESMYRRDEFERDSEKKLLPKMFVKQFDKDIHIEDDHVPFLLKHVNVLHLIPHPFPSFWHTKNDDLSHVHWESTMYFTHIFFHWVAEFTGVPIIR